MIDKIWMEMSVGLENEFKVPRGLKLSPQHIMRFIAVTTSIWTFMHFEILIIWVAVYNCRYIRVFTLPNLNFLYYMERDELLIYSQYMLEWRSGTCPFISRSCCCCLYIFEIAGYKNGKYSSWNWGCCLKLIFKLKKYGKKRFYDFQRSTRD